MLKEIVVDGVVMGSVEVPDGWELVGFRVPEIDGYFITNDIGDVRKCHIEFGAKQCRWIVRKAFVWPACVKPGTWCAKDKDGFVYLFDHKPYIGHGDWRASDGIVLCMDPAFFNVPDLPGDWKDSLRQKPLEGK